MRLLASGVKTIFKKKLISARNPAKKSEFQPDASIRHAFLPGIHLGVIPEKRYEVIYAELTP